MSRKYKDYDGYSLLFGYLVKEGFIPDYELQPAKQHCQVETVKFLERGKGLIKELGFKIIDLFCVRMLKIFRLLKSQY